MARVRRRGPSWRVRAPAGLSTERQARAAPSRVLLLFAHDGQQRCMFWAGRARSRRVCYFALVVPITEQYTVTGWRQPHDLSCGISEGAANLACLPIELSLKGAKLVPAVGRCLGRGAGRKWPFEGRWCGLGKGKKRGLVRMWQAFEVICSGFGGFRGASWRLVRSLGLRLGRKQVGGRAVLVSGAGIIGSGSGAAADHGFDGLVNLENAVDLILSGPCAASLLGVTGRHWALLGVAGRTGRCWLALACGRAVFLLLSSPSPPGTQLYKDPLNTIPSFPASVSCCQRNGMLFVPLTRSLVHQASS